MLRDSAELLAPAVAETIAALELKPEDAAAVKLAERYAAAIDNDGEGDALDRLGPKLHAVLESLGATPAARAKLKGGRPADGKPSRLQQLRGA
jgi:hypothetical protein